MEPTFREGDVLLVRWFSEIAPELALCSVVVIEREEMPGIFFIKRIQKSHGGSYWVEGDNRKPEIEELAHDSRKWGTSPHMKFEEKFFLEYGKRNKTKNGKMLRQ